MRSHARAFDLPIFRSLVPSFFRSFVRSFVLSFVYSLVRSFVLSIFRSLVRSFARLLFHSLFRWFARLLVRSFDLSFACLLVCYSGRLFVYSLRRSFILAHQFVRSFVRTLSSYLSDSLVWKFERKSNLTLKWLWHSSLNQNNSPVVLDAIECSIPVFHHCSAATKYWRKCYTTCRQDEVATTTAAKHREGNRD